METREKKKQARLKVTCDTCGFAMSDIKGTSLTSWIFGKSCQCATDVNDDSMSAEEGNASTQELTDINERYETLSVLGSGGMGTVYRVKDKTLDKVFALKVLRPELANDREAVVRFKQEVSAAQNLSHPSLVSVYDWGLSTEGSPYFVMDYVEGRSLSDIIKNEKSLGLQRCIDLLLQVSDALAHAHENNIVHRDLKSSNILITSTEDGTEFVKVVDFGIAKILPPPGKDTVSLTKTAEIFGSPAYMSPEQCKGERVDKRSDIYSFGCVMFECLIGQPPFARENPVKTILAHIYDQPPSVRSKLVGYSAPDSVAAVVNHCLNKDPADRYNSVEELIKDLHLLRDGKPPIALTRVSKEKRRRQLKFLGFKYSPQVLTLLSIILLIFAVMDLPWLLTLAELQAPKAVRTTSQSRANLAMQLVARANDYNKPYALLMAAEADLESGLLSQSREKAESALAIFKEKKDLPDTLIAYKLLIAERLREGNFAAARQLTKEVTNLQFANLTSPKKGMRLIGWFYLPSLPARLLDCQLVNSDLLFSYGDEEGAIASLDDAIAALKVKGAADITNDVRRITLKKISMLFKSGKKEEATALLDRLMPNPSAANLTSNEYFDIGLEVLRNGLVGRAKTLFEAMPVIEGTGIPRRELALALCYSLEGNSGTVAQYDRAAECVIAKYRYDRNLGALQLAGVAADLRGPQYIDVFYKEMIAAVDRIGTKEALKLPEPVGNIQRWTNFRLVEVYLLNGYANALSLNGRTVEANRMRVRAVKSIPRENDEKWVWQRLGAGFVLDKNYAKAQALFNASYDPSRDGSRPLYGPDMLGSACALALAGDYDEAIKRLNEVAQDENLEFTNDRAKAYTALGNIALKQSDTEAAMKYFELSMRELRTPTLGDGDLNVYNRIRLAKLKELNGKTTEALEQFNHGVLRADSPFLQQRALRSYGELLARTGDIEGSKIILNRADTQQRLDTTHDTMLHAAEDLDLRVQINDFISDPVYAPTIKKQ